MDAVVRTGSPGLAEELEREVAGFSGVVDVEVVYPRRYRVYGAWFDRSIASAIAKGA